MEAESKVLCSCIYDSLLRGSEDWKGWFFEWTMAALAESFREKFVRVKRG